MKDLYNLWMGQSNSGGYLYDIEDYYRLTRDEAYKCLYNINEFTTITIDSNKAWSGYRGEIKSIKTGIAGKILINSFDKKYSYLVELDKKLDPVEATEDFNPKVGGYRLSSYTFIIDIDGKILKLLPSKP